MNPELFVLQIMEMHLGKQTKYKFNSRKVLVDVDVDAAVDADLAVVSVVAVVDAGALVDADVNAADVVDGGSTLGEAANSC